MCEEVTTARTIVNGVWTGNEAVQKPCCTLDVHSFEPRFIVPVQILHTMVHAAGVSHPPIPVGFLAMGVGPQCHVSIFHTSDGGLVTFSAGCLCQVLRWMDVGVMVKFLRELA